MKKENRMMTAPYLKTFEDTPFGYDISAKELIVNTIRVYGLDRLDSIQSEVQFDIKRSGDKLVLYPRDTYRKYFLKAEQVVTATILKMEVDDYYSVSEKDGNYMFVLNEHD